MQETGIPSGRLFSDVEVKWAVQFLVLETYMPRASGCSQLMSDGKGVKD
jgi:hypothetical protein